MKLYEIKPNQDKVRPISGAMLDEMVRIARSVVCKTARGEARRLPGAVLYCRICEHLFKLPEIIFKYNECAKVQPLQSVEFHKKDFEISSGIASVFISTLITCDLFVVGFGEKYDTLSTDTRMNFDGKTIRGICYELSQRLPNCGINYLSDTMMREFVRDLLRLAEILKVDVRGLIMSAANE